MKYLFILLDYFIVKFLVTFITIHVLLFYPVLFIVLFLWNFKPDKTLNDFVKGMVKDWYEYIMKHHTRFSQLLKEKFDN